MKMGLLRVLMDILVAKSNISWNLFNSDQEVIAATTRCSARSRFILLGMKQSQQSGN
jgi:hypothetical protein